MTRTLILTIDTDIPDDLYPEVLLEPGSLVDVIVGEGGVVGQVVAIEQLPAGTRIAVCQPVHLDSSVRLAACLEGGAAHG